MEIALLGLHKLPIASLSSCHQFWWELFFRTWFRNAAQAENFPISWYGYSGRSFHVKSQSCVSMQEWRRIRCPVTVVVTLSRTNKMVWYAVQIWVHNPPSFYNTVCSWTLNDIFMYLNCKIYVHGTDFPQENEAFIPFTHLPAYCHFF